MLDVLSDDYIRTARSKGAVAARCRLAARPAQCTDPVVTLSGVEFGYLLGGAVIVEQNYGASRLGRLTLDAISQRDYALVQGAVLFIALNFLVVNLLLNHSPMRHSIRASGSGAGNGFAHRGAAAPHRRVGAAIILLFLVIAALGAIGLTPHDPLKQFVIDRLKPPSGTYWFGTDLFGRDTFSRLMLGIGESFLVAFASVAVAATAGTVIGLFARPGWAPVGRHIDADHGRAAGLSGDPARTVDRRDRGPRCRDSITAIFIVYTPIFARVVPSARAGAQGARIRRGRTSPSAARNLHPVAPPAAQSRRAADGADHAGARLGPADRIRPPASWVSARSRRRPSLGMMLAESKSMMTRAPWLMVFPASPSCLLSSASTCSAMPCAIFSNPRTQERSA